jgi:hypothetical protein
MRSFWEQIGVLGPIYRLLGRGLNNDDIATRLNITQEKVEGCIAWATPFPGTDKSSRSGSIRLEGKMILLSLGAAS